jgi:hypothetical protein
MPGVLFSLPIGLVAFRDHFAKATKFAIGLCLRFRYYSASTDDYRCELGCYELLSKGFSPAFPCQECGGTIRKKSRSKVV